MSERNERIIITARSAHGCIIPAASIECRRGIMVHQ